ncbi:MAG TPA: ribosomal protein S18-alanine N-acetyltransferase [Pyrinomonadaceae bacterium]|nr:ribosomal protein S18-alanine N-acetyltransferase [Pyrinomonadaceae bacterium]
MAVLQTLRNFFIPLEAAEPEVVVPAPQTEYAIHPLTDKHLNEVLRLNVRCFRNGENYTKHTFNYLLGEPRNLSYRIVTSTGEMAGFVFVLVNQDGSAHLTTIGVAPEHRRRQLASRLLSHTENALRHREVRTIVLEVRVSNTTAQDLYRESGYSVVQRLAKYYNNGEDCFLMLKSLV